MTHDITIVGAGLLGAMHLSREAESALRSARVVFCSAYNVGVAEHVRALNPKAEVCLSEKNEYRLGMYRPEMYRRMARVVVDAASAGPGVVMLSPGSAMVVDLVTQCVLELARSASLAVRVLPGISSIESVLAEVEYDASNGLAVVLAQKLVLQHIELNASIASIVLQPAYFDTLHLAGAPWSSEGRFDALERQLARTLPEDAPMALVITPTEPGVTASVFWFRRGTLGRLHRVLSPLHTLFVPPARSAASDDAFAARISSWEQCLAHVELDADGKVLQRNRRATAADISNLPAELREDSTRLAERWRARMR